ncbi:hypothetical protein SIAM614_18934 [Roseibium aggregatum IAM 12614]|uniref:Uncharacterized protein n=1 Tax=Roseibium aggregatum (strain ATCC 25650 / DSM 13394 / JCM 20685 / NBRC 16684 / NCIMB 2208 / IAM 12614 / B1) TaxID=384765 RepID=A0NPR7_ROSAI|nr:hypothetical protein SIAM614_18934 [Roseibium aggregatum IAM 12614]
MYKIFPSLSCFARWGNLCLRQQALLYRESQEEFFNDVNQIGSLGQNYDEIASPFNA